MDITTTHTDDYYQYFLQMLSAAGRLVGLCAENGIAASGSRSKAYTYTFAYTYYT